MAENTGFIDLMSFARGAELGNQMNWRDVINDVNARTNENALAQNQQQWALNYPLAQEQAQGAMDKLQANREAGQNIASVYQQAAALPAEQRPQFIAEALNQRVRSLDSGTAAGAAQISAVNNTLLHLAQRAAAAGDYEGAKRMLTQSAYTLNPMAGRDQALTRAQNATTGLEEALRDPNKMFYVNPATGMREDLSALRFQLQRLQALQNPQTGVPVGESLAPGESVAPNAMGQAPAVRSAAPATGGQAQLAPAYGWSTAPQLPAASPYGYAGSGLDGTAIMNAAGQAPAAASNPIADLWRYLFGSTQAPAGATGGWAPAVQQGATGGWAPAGGYAVPGYDVNPMFNLPQAQPAFKQVPVWLTQGAAR